MRRSKMARRIVAVTMAACLLGCTVAHAKKPDNTGGGGAGGAGGGEETPPRFSVLELPVDGDPVAINEPGASNVLTVAIASAGSAAFAQVNRVTGEIVESGYLPEPDFVDVNDGEMKNGPSSPHDVNDLGQIAGDAAAFDPDQPASNPSPGRAILWTPVGDTYAYELLPSLSPGAYTYAIGVNNWADVVGQSDGQAVRWDPLTHEIVNLNSVQTAAEGWELTSANDINDDGLVAGRGLLDGAIRGFVLDLNTGSIWAAPLVGPATGAVANRINALGRVVGVAWDGEGVHYGTNPDYVRGFSWDGPGSDPVALTPVTSSTSMSYGINDLGASVGNSRIPQDDIFADDQVPTLWEFDATGNLTATDLTSEIPNKPSWFLLRSWDVNNDGWVSVLGRKFVKGRYYWRALLLVPSGGN